MKYNNKRFLSLFLVVIFNIAVINTSHAWWWNKPSVDEYTKTKYPIVLVPGLPGFDNVADLIIYWPGVVDNIERSGGKVYVLATSLANSSTYRGDIIIKELDELKAVHGYERFNLIGHSQGGLDVRYVAGLRPDLVASATAMATPHDVGTLSFAPDLLESDTFFNIGDALLQLLADLSDNENTVDTSGALYTFKKENLQRFNEAFPAGLPSQFCGEGNTTEWIDGYPINFYSWSGVNVFSNAFDPAEFLHGLVSATVPGPNDGFVNKCGSHFGKVIRDNYRLNHFDHGNLLFGLVNWFETNPKTILRVHANRLKNDGL